jgi:hypothetical protein
MGNFRHVLITAAALAAATSCVSEPNPRAEAPPPVAPMVVEATPAPVAPAPEPVPFDAQLFAALSAQATDLDRRVLELALSARECALANGDAIDPGRLAVIDYSVASTEPRLWVFDTTARRLMYREHVAHGQKSGHNMTTSFSNTDGSHQTSLGLFRTAETYVGGNGYSMRMDGLEPGWNDNARDRLIVMHGAAYVNPAQARKQGRLGRSYGCPAVRTAVAREIIDVMKDGQLLFSYYPDDAWLASSRFLSCDKAVLAAYQSREPRGGAGLHTAAR